MVARSKMPLTKTKVLILGFGHAQLYKPESAFSLRQVVNASVDNGYNVDISNLYVPASQLATDGLLFQSSRRFKEPTQKTGAPTLRYTFEQAGLEPLVECVMHGVRSLRQTLPDILKIQESVYALVDYADFFGRLQKDLLVHTENATAGTLHQIAQS